MIDKDVFVDFVGYDFVVDYLMDVILIFEQLDGFFSFVCDGGVYLGFYCVVDFINVYDGDGGFDKCDELFFDFCDFFGGYFFIYFECLMFGVEIVFDYVVIDGVGGFEVFDELYQVDVDDDVIVFVCMVYFDFIDYLVVWVCEYGLG